jgi:gamma-glutamyltranspeptidase/glutathione hydrolase
MDHVVALSEDNGSVVAPSLLTGVTIYTCAIDREGNACTLIQSIYYAFGSAFAVGETGTVLHNRAHYFNLEPRSANCIAPRKRPAHTLIAAMALRSGQPALVFGTMGADGQPQTVTQVAMRLFAGEDAQHAVSAARFLSGRFLLEDPDDLLLIEKGFSPDTLEELAARGHIVQPVDRLDERMGHAHAIVVRRDGVVEAGSDPRSDGSALVLQEA